MHKLLTAWLEKKGIKTPEDLDNTPMPDGSPTERQIFEEYKSILAKPEISLADVKDFCARQLMIIDTKWASFDKKNEEKAELIPYYTVYKLILSVIDAPITDRKSLEQQLEQLTNK